MTTSEPTQDVMATWPAWKLALFGAGLLAVAVLACIALGAAPLEALAIVGAFVVILVGLVVVALFVLSQLDAGSGS